MYLAKDLANQKFNLILDLVDVVLQLSSARWGVGERTSSSSHTHVPGLVWSTACQPDYFTTGPTVCLVLQRITIDGPCRDGFGQGKEHCLDELI